MNIQQNLRMAIKTLNISSPKCPQLALKIAAKSPDMELGDIVEVIGYCPPFGKDIRAWCHRLNKFVLSYKTEGNGK